MKFKTFLAIYKNIIILIWWIIILIIFQITTKFEFHNGSSLIFILLMFILPLILYIFGVIYKHQLVKTKRRKKEPFFNQIKNDYENKKIKKEFIDKLPLNVSDHMTEDAIMISNEEININFNKAFVSININNTKIIFRYYYTFNLKEFTKYDQKLLQYRSTSYLYTVLLNQINLLVEADLQYFESKNDCKLIDLTSNNILFTTFKKPFKKRKYNLVSSIKITKKATSNK